MKLFFKILGWVIGLTLIVAAMYSALVIGESYYVAAGLKAKPVAYGNVDSAPRATDAQAGYDRQATVNADQNNEALSQALAAHALEAREKLNQGDQAAAKAGYDRLANAPPSQGPEGDAMAEYAQQERAKADAANEAESQAEYARMSHAGPDQRKGAQTDTPQIREAITSLGNNMTPDFAESKKEADELAGKLPTLFVDPEGYKTEDNWLATNISREIAEMAFVAVSPSAQLPDLAIKAIVDPDKPQVHIEINGFSSEMTTSDLNPAFAWDPEGYAALAKQLLGTTPGSPPAPESAATDVLDHLLNLTGANLAAEDVRLSANLLQHPTSWQDHEASALILTAMTMREEAGVYSEKRTMLNRATAHLAMAKALRGDQAPTWPGLIADAAIRTLAGRELDALSRLDALAARTDVPESAKTWMAALRVLAKQDWRAAEVTATSPLLLKIVWFRILELDLVPDLAVKHLKDVMPQAAADPNLPPDQQEASLNTLIPDWGRIAGRSPFDDQADDATKNAEYRIGIEFKDLDEILKAEGAAPYDLDHLAEVYSEKETDTVSRDADGKTVVRVIGTAIFKDASRRHVFAAIPAKSPLADPSQDPAQIENLLTKFDQLLQGVPGWDMARMHLNLLDSDEYNKQIADWVAAKKTWRIWEVPYQLANTMPGYAFVKNFYRRAVPFGTVFDQGLNDRYTFVNDVDPQVMPPFDTPELEKLKALPLDQAHNAIGDYTLRYNAKIQEMAPHGPKPFELELLKLDPDEYVLAQDHVPNDKLLAAVAQFLDYNMNPIERIERLDADHLSDTDRINILRKHVALEPAFGFRAAIVLRSKGLDDEAADMERKAFATLEDPNENPNADPNSIAKAVLPLVDYDLRHGLNDEALKVAQYVAQAQSQMGMGIYAYALEQTGRLDEAVGAAKLVKDRYADANWLTGIYIRHRDRYNSEYDNALSEAFPDGLVRAAMADFSGDPKGGDQIKSDSDALRAAGLKPGDVIVALNGYRINSDLQYCFVRELTTDSHMEFIIWRDGEYLDVKTSVPARRMMVDLADYVPN